MPRQHLNTAIGNQGRLLTELIPELELLLGEHPHPGADVTPEEAENRLKNALLNLIQAFIRPGRRLVLFLDDLHLADAPSLAFLKTVAQHHAGQNLLLIAAYDENAPAEDESFAGLLETFRRDADTTERLEAAGWTVVRAWEHEDPVEVDDAPGLVGDDPPPPPQAAEAAMDHTMITASFFMVRLPDTNGL